MSFDHCLISLDLSAKLPVSQLRDLSKKYTAAGVSVDTAMRIVLNDQLEAHRAQEKAIVAAVRSAWESQGRPGALEAPRDKNQAPDLNEMFTQLLAEEAAAKPKSDDLNSMFNELLAEVSGVDPRPTVANVVEGTKPAAAGEPKARRVKAKNRFATLEQEAERLPHLKAISDAKYPIMKPKTADEKKAQAKKIAAAEKELSFLPPGILTPEAMHNLRPGDLATPASRLEAARSMVSSLEHGANTALGELRQGDWKNDAEAWADFTKRHKNGPHMSREYFDMLGAGTDVDALRAEPAKAPKTEVGNEWRETDPKNIRLGDDVDHAIGKPIKKLAKAGIYSALTKSPALAVKVAERIILLRPDLAAEARAIMRDELGYRIKNGQWEKVGRGTQPARAMDYTGRPVDGHPVLPGDAFKTSSGRETTNYPTKKTERAASEWLIENAKAEAEARGDDFNARTFGATKPLKSGDLTEADRASMLEYVFGQQPAVAPKMTKPMRTNGDAFREADARAAEARKQQAQPNERPLAAAGLTNYRYKGPKGYVMIGAKSDTEALNEAGRSISDLRHEIDPANLEVWHDHSKSYVPVDEAPKTSRVTPQSYLAKLAKDPAAIKHEQIRKILIDAGPMAPEVAGIIGEQPHLVTTVGKEMEALGWKFDRFEGPNMTPLFTKPGQRGAGEAAVSAAKHGTLGFAAAIGGLGELFGVNPDMKSGIIQLDETKYQKAQPFFQAAIANFGQAAADIRDVMKAVIKAVYDKFGHETTANMQPYVVRFIEDYSAGKFKGETNAAESAPGSAARDQEHRTDEKPAAEQDIFDVSGAIDESPSGTARESDGPGREQVDGTGISGRDAATAREEGGQQLRERKSGSDGRPAEPRDTAGSGASGRAGARPDAGPAGDAGNAARARAEQGSKLEQQRAAASVPVKLGDRANIDATLPYLLEPQRGDVHFAEQRFEAAAAGKMPGVLFTNGTGTGKTASGAGIITRQILAGNTEGIIVVPNTGIAKDWIDFGKRLGIDIKMLESTTEHGGSGPTITTYANFGANRTLADREYHWVMADESHYLMAAKDGSMTDALSTFRALTRHPDGFAAFSRMKNRDLHDKLGTIDNKESPEAREIFRQLRDREGYLLSNYNTAPASRPKAIFLSATPFAYVKSVDYAEGYLFHYPEDGKIGNSNQDGRAKFFVEHFGYRIRYHKLTEPDGKVDVGLMARQFNSYLKKEGALSGRMLEVEHDYGRRFMKVESALGSKIDEGMEFMREHPEYKHLYGPFMKQFNYLKRRYLLEAIKAKEALPIIQQHLDMGRKVVVIHDYKKGGASNPFTMDGINGTTTAYDSSMSPKSIDLAALADKFKAERPDLVRLSFPSTSALQTLQGAFPNALVHNGDIDEKQLEQNKVHFNSDDSGRNLIILQSDKGREGISLHDTTGKHPRVEVIVGMAAKPTALIQLEGRIYRTGQMSNAAFDYVVTGTNWERWTFAQTIAERTDIAEALAMGDDARALKDSIVEAFENAGQHEITANDGTGGKARDRQASKLLTDWDRAKSFYYSQLKRNSSTKALEGKDYFATPEPVGLKMVEWADIRPGEDVLEPSAGHGAIARWFPTLSNKTINEVESGLIGKARLAVDGKARFIQAPFEDLDLVNKYDTIVMNPPFGVGGSQAIPHLAKAYQHLRDGGRIVALLPKGPAADGKLEKFLYGDKAPKDLYMVADIELPGSTFSRAGTGVMTHIVVLDKISDPSKAPQQVARSYASADDVEELFDRIQHSTVPGRVKTTQPLEIQLEQNKPAPKKQPREAAPDATGAERYYAQFEFNHTKTGAPLFGAAMLNRTSMDTYKDAASIAKKYGGWYNKFVGGGALRGFLFKSAEDRTAFMAEAGQLAEVSAGHDAQNSLTGDLGIDSQLIDHMESIADSRGMVQADKLLPWVQQQSAPGAEKLANWLEVMGDATVAQSSVVKFMENSGNAMFSSMPGFYSALARTLPGMAKIAAKDGTVKAEQARLWLQSRQKEGKFKAEELQWSGVDDWLKAQGGRVSVDDIANFLEHNGVQVHEVQKSTTWAVYDPMDRAESYFDTEDEARAYAKEHNIPSVEVFPTQDNINATKYSQYTLHGGKNYRELLLTLPQNNTELMLPELLRQLPDGYDVSFDRTQPEGRQYSIIPPGQMHGQPYGAVRAGSAEEARAEALAVLNSERDNAARDAHRNQTSEGIYKSSHWDEHNIIAHIRFNDRTDADGKRVLFIEELQSDWGQQGLKQGFAGANDLTQAQIHEAMQAARAAIKANDYLGFDSMGEAMNAIRRHADWADRWEVDTEEQRHTLDRYRDIVARQEQLDGKPPVAPAPFVTDTKAWLGLGIKRMIRYAAENGYDRVAFVNGEQSAARYDLSKQVDSIDWFRDDSGRYGVAANKGERTIINRNGLTASDVEDMLGKDVSKKIIESDKKTGSLEGLDLKLGGEGMKQFYDKIVPQTVNDVLKKLGGGKMGATGLVTDSRLMRGFDYSGPSLTEDQIAEVMRTKNLSAAIEAQLKEVRFDVMEGVSFQQAMEKYGSPAAAEAVGGQLTEKDPEAKPQPSFDITPELRAQAMEGMPMFQRAGDTINQGRRNLLALAAAAAMGDAQGKAATLGQAKPINSAVLDQRVPASVEKILRKDGISGRQNESGVTNMKGAPALREALRAIALTGPKELRALAGQVAKLLPADGVMLTVDDTRRMNVHGVVELSPFVHMQLFTAEGRTGLTYGTIIHEAMHVAVAARYRSLSVGMARSNDKLLGLSAPAAAHALEQFEGVWNEFRELTAGEKFTNRDLELAVTEARGNPDEFFVRALTDPLLQTYLSGKRYQGKTLFERFKDWVKTKLFGFMEDGGTAPSWLDAALTASGDVVQAMGGDRSDFARMKAINRFQASRSENSRANIQEGTPEFKQWFGDSKLVDPATGAPQVLYHGTRDSINSFNLDHPNRKDTGWLGTGVYMTDDADLAESYARLKHGENGPTIMPLYGRLENPYMATAGEKEAMRAGGRARADEWTAELKAQGHDGVILPFSDGSHEIVVFDPAGVKSAIGNNGDFDRNNPDIMAARALPSSWDMPDDTRMDKVIQAMQDTHIDTKRALKAINDALGDRGDKWDPYLQEELYHGRSATGIKNFLHDELRPLMVDMNARGVSMQQMEEFLHMRHAEEANDYLAGINPGSPDGLAGVSTADARAYLAGLPAAQLAKLTALAARVDAIQRETRAAMVSYGLEKQDTIDRWDNTYQHYVPLHREDMEHGMMGNGTGSGFSVRGPASKARTGSKRAVVDILANIAMARERAIVRGEKNRIAMALYGLALQAPNGDFWKPINPQKNPAALDAELLNMGLSPAEKGNLGAEPRSRRVGKSGMVESYVNLAARNAPNVVSVRVNGEDRFLFFNQHDERAMRMAEAMKNLDTDTLGYVMGKIASGTRLYAALNTQFNPIFGIVNLTRDTSEGSINLSSTPLAGKQHQVLLEAGRLLGKVIVARGRLENLKGADLALWHEFEKEGGITGFRAMFSRSEDRTAELARELRRIGRNPVMKVSGAIWDWLSDYNEALENITRLSAYKVAKDNGLTNQRAASLAKNLTVNFNRKGSKTRQVGALYAFFNASVQGIARAAQTLGSKAGKLIIAGGLLVGAMQSSMLHYWGFDNADIPEFIQAKNLVIPASRPGHGKNYVTIPLPQGFAFLPSIGRISTDFALGGGKQPGKYGARLLETVLDTFNPIGGAGNIAQILSPTLSDPIVDLWGNQDWTGKKIAREDFSQLHPTPGFTRTKDTASAVGKFLSHSINAMTGGTEYTPGHYSWTPDQIDYFLGQFTGGVGRELSKAQQMVAAHTTGEDLPWNKVPLFGRFYGDVNDKSAISSRFYDNVKDLGEVRAELEGRRKNHIDTTKYRAEHPDYKLAEKSEVVLRELSDLHHQRRHYLELGDKVRVKEYELKMRKVMEKFNADVGAQQATAK